MHSAVHGITHRTETAIALQRLLINRFLADDTPPQYMTALV
jgi:hypothetical protein